MYVDTRERNEPGVLHLQSLLRKIDRLRLPTASRRDIESILVRQVGEDLERTFPWQAGHGARTAVIACALGEELRLAKIELHNLKLAALLHDIGLLMLPTQLRGSHGSLDPASYIAVQNHSRLGATLLEPFGFLREASILIAHHHERWDGSGYPYGIRGEFIPLGARILAVADAFEAIQVPRQDRSSRNRIALRILRVASGTQFDPSLVEALSSIAESRSNLSLANFVTDYRLATD
jgi:HD-GYP domain-containing protein (c-di-GMP phosphodiesterase class II)